MGAVRACPLFHADADHTWAVLPRIVRLLRAAVMRLTKAHVTAIDTSDRAGVHECATYGIPRIHLCHSLSGGGSVCLMQHLDVDMCWTCTHVDATSPRRMTYTTGVQVIRGGGGGFRL